MADKLFVLEDMRSARYSLRRYAGEGKCTGKMGYHNARSAAIADVPEDPEKPYTGTRPPDVDHADPRWPARCECGYAFAETDTWQVFADGLYRNPETGAVLTWDEAPAGSVRDATWWPDKGADGHAWGIKLADGTEWMTEGGAANCCCRTAPQPPEHRCWSRTGTMPKITVSPSIATPRWHGWLRDGVLISC